MKSFYLEQQNAFMRYFESHSSGQTLVYLPAISFSVAASFFDVATHSGLPNHRAFLIDYLGSGESDHSDQFSYSLEDHVASVAAVLDNAECREVTIFGHSMGGTIGILLAITRPDLIANLIVGEGNVTSGGGGLARQIAAYEESDFVNDVFPKMMADNFTSAKKGDVIGLRRSAVWKHTSALGLYRNACSLVNIGDSLKTDFFNLPIPKTFVYGEKSVPHSQDDVGPDTPFPDELRAHGVETRVVPKAGHGLMFDNLDGFVEVLSSVAF
jgi:pimeloyl-ACP methyl ester carboxylesterase